MKIFKLVATDKNGKEFFVAHYNTKDKYLRCTPNFIDGHEYKSKAGAGSSARAIYQAGQNGILTTGFHLGYTFEVKEYQA